MRVKNTIGLLLILGLTIMAVMLLNDRSVQTAYNKILHTIPPETNEHDVLLLLARAYSLKYNLIKNLQDKTRLEELLSRLETTAYLNTSDKIGWGLSFAWDAFQDQTTNPQDTIYTYTTAFAGLAFLDAYEATNNNHYLTIAKKAAHTLLTETCCWKNGEGLSV